MSLEVKIALSDRYVAAFTQVETQLRHLARRKGQLNSELGQERDLNELINLAGRQKWLREDSVRFLHSCRKARNAFTHVSFLEYDGPVALPPEPVVHRLERVASALVNPPKAKAVSQIAVTCQADDPISQVLSLMHERDFSQVPYKGFDEQWYLLTHQNVSRWLAETSQGEAPSLIDLQSTVTEVVEISGITTQVIVTDSSALVSELIATLEGAVGVPDDQLGGYAAVLVACGHDTVRIFTPDDLPRALDVLGR